MENSTLLMFTFKLKDILLIFSNCLQRCVLIDGHDGRARQRRRQRCQVASASQKREREGRPLIPPIKGT